MKYEAVIGLEVHIQVRTASKMFCACPNRSGDAPNTNVCPVCMAYPGALPVPNREAIRQTVRAGLLTNCEIARFSKFDRKNYFYPDASKNYQISQFDLPFCSKGHIDIEGVGFSGAPLAKRAIGITRIHLEEDVAKLTHGSGPSGVDFNRCGLALIEAVSEPDMHTPDEAYAYLTNLKEIMRYGNISDCDMEKGQLRCDVNVSLRPVGQEKLGTKIEIKNLNSFRSAHRALEYEIWRQAKELDAGKVFTQETRGWDDDLGETYAMRSKEQAQDYRYFPEPDILPVTFTEEDIEELRATLPELPEAMRARFVREYALTEYDAGVLTQNRELAPWFDRAARAAKNPKLAANWVISDLLRELGAREIALSDCPFAPEALAELVNAIDSGAINGTIAKTVFTAMFESGKSPKTIIAEQGLAQVSDESAIAKFADDVIAANPAQVEQYRAGNPKVLQFLIGQLMKASKGKANPQLAGDLLRKRLEK